MIERIRQLIYKLPLWVWLLIISTGYFWIGYRIGHKNGYEKGLQDLGAIINKALNGPR